MRVSFNAVSAKSTVCSYSNIEPNALGKYAVSENVIELTAETLARQILKYPKTIKPYDKSTLFNFPDVHDEKGLKYLRSIWDGNIDGLENLTEKIHKESAEKNWDSFPERADYVMAALGL